LRGVTLVAGFRLQVAARRVVTWLLLAIALLSILRLVVCAPLAGRHWRRQRRADRWRRRFGAGRNLPQLRISILIPAHNEEPVIAKTLRALDRQRDGVEVIVIDDGSTDNTAEIATRFPIKVLRQAQAGKAAALNHGIAEAKGDIVVVLDADTVLTPDFATTIARHFADPKVGAVAGNVKVGNRRGLLPRLQALEYIGSLNLDRRAQATLNVVNVVPGAAGAFRRSAILEVGGYSSDTLVEDADLTISLLRAGWRIPYEPVAVAWTEAPEGVRDVIRQRRRWSYGTVEVAAKHADIALDPRKGNLGLVGLPWLILTQVILPLGGPLTDLYLLYLVAMHSYGSALAILAVALILDLAIIAGAVLADREDRRLLLVTPFMRLVWRPLQLIAAIRSVRRWMLGRNDKWRRVNRHNSVPTLSSELATPEPISGGIQEPPESTLEPGRVA
jgi:cellulose synthase/poly-beta-1,6-N-acetylglucosamine synthase-like glycosyltransferase